MTTCKSCQSGYIINYNLYKKNLYKFTNTTERNVFDILFKAQKNNWRFDSGLNFCEPVVATNCATLASFNLCASCMDGYYLDSTTKVCTLFPEPIIPNCNIYAYDDIFRWKYKCVSCKDNFFLKDKKTCSAVTIDANCDAYDTTANTTSCIRCKQAKLLTNGSCTTDRTIVTNCNTYMTSVNKCSICNDTYTLNTEGNACKKVTPNCKTPVAFDANTVENVKCSKCADEYYLVSADGTCLKGAKKCKEYASETTCSSCLN